MKKIEITGKTLADNLTLSGFLTLIATIIFDYSFGEAIKDWWHYFLAFNTIDLVFYVLLKKLEKEVENNDK